MSVVNVKVAHIRPRYDNLKEWCEDPNNIYIGRKGIVFIDGKRYPEKDSFWANPYKIDKDGNIDEIIEKYRIHILKKLEEHPSKIEELRNKNLGCWCKPNKCHGDVLMKILKMV